MGVAVEWRAFNCTGLMHIRDAGDSLQGNLKANLSDGARFLLGWMEKIRSVFQTFD